MNMKKIAAAVLAAVGYRENPICRFCWKSSPEAKKFMASLLVAMSVSGAVGSVAFSAPQATGESMAKDRAAASSSAAANQYTQLFAEIDAAVIKIFEKSHKTLKENPAAKKELGPEVLEKVQTIFALCKEGKAAEAIPVIRELVGSQKGETRRLLRVLAYELSGDYDKAIADATQDIENDARDKYASMTRILAHFRKGWVESHDVHSPQISLALRDMDDCLVLLNPGEAEVVCTIAAHLRKDRAEYPAAVQMLNRTILLRPSANLFRLRAECYAKMDFDAGKMRGDNDAARITPKSWQIPDGKERAIADLDKVIALNPKAFSAFMMRIGLKAELHDFKGAWEDVALVRKIPKTKKQKEDFFTIRRFLRPGKKGNRHNPREAGGGVRQKSRGGMNLTAKSPHCPHRGM